jgi:hypothetical protein
LASSMSALSELVSDPVFQLNSLLWLTQPMPADAGLRPVLREGGFEVDAICLLLTPPPDILLQFKDSGLAHQDHIRPDMVLCRQQDGRYGVVECKGNSFGVDSSTAQQARTLLVAAGPRLDESLGLESGTIKRSVASYLVPSPTAGHMRLTLEVLDGELRSGKLPVGTSCVLALESGTEAVSLVADGTARGFFNLPAEKIDFVRLEEGTDPRPLYFIPYDPDCSQSEEERAYCKRVLFERIQASLLGAGGRALPPTDLLFDAVGLLNDATLGMYGLWENRDSAKHMRRLVRQLLTKLAEILRSEVGDVFRFVENKGWTLQVPDESTKDAICNALSKFSCETMDLRQEPPQLELFEDQADE